MKNTLIIGAVTVIVAIALASYMYGGDDKLTLTEEEAIEIVDQHETMLSWKGSLLSIRERFVTMTIT